jgi:hypothetical protein
MYVIRVRLISFPCGPNGPPGPFDPCPDRARPTHYGWRTPVTLHYIKRFGAGGTQHEVRRAPYTPLTYPNDLGSQQ